MVVILLAAFVAYRWTNSVVHPVSVTTALDRFRSEGSTTARSTPLVPAAGVYMYTGSGSERVSVPPKTQDDGPSMPGTVTRQGDGCWSIRIDFSDAHWEGSSYCASGGGLVETGRQGWMKWDYVAVVVADTSTFSCQPPEPVLPANLDSRTGQRFTCTGSNDQLKTGPVLMTGTTTVVGVDQLTIGGQKIEAVHVRETATFSRGQTGSHATEVWYGPDGMPVRVSWSETVRTPSPIGTATMTGSGQYHLVSLKPRT